jgi:Rieske Fe-S protein
VLPVDVTLPGPKHEPARVFLVRRDDKSVLGLLGVSTHLGCRVLWPEDPKFGVGVAVNDRIEYEDPCGGSVFAVDGACVGGPCPRGLDRYPVTVKSGNAEFDLAQLQQGPARSGLSGS